MADVKLSIIYYSSTGTIHKMAERLREAVDHGLVHDPPRGDAHHLADLRVWLDGLRDDLGRIPSVPEPADTERHRLAERAGGAVD